jgi:hypothetical protein
MSTTSLFETDADAGALLAFPVLAVDAVGRGVLVDVPPEEPDAEDLLVPAELDGDVFPCWGADFACGVSVAGACLGGDDCGACFPATAPAEATAPRMTRQPMNESFRFRESLIVIAVRSWQQTIGRLGAVSRSACT